MSIDNLSYLLISILDVRSLDVKRLEAGIVKQYASFSNFSPARCLDVKNLKNYPNS